MSAERCFRNEVQSTPYLNSGATTTDKDEQMRKSILAVLAIAAIGIAAPNAASARGGHRGGFHDGGGFHGGGGFRGGGFHGGGFRGAGFRGGYGYRRGFSYGGLGLGVGLGLGSYYGGYGYPYAYSGYYDNECYLVRRRVATPYGWRIRTVRACG